jgi:glycosyltransferase involved in cell wall biosynthesis
MTDPIVTHPLVSVIIPAYKARNFLRESLASVAAQDYPNLEVWVIDDKSPEPIEDIVSGYRQNPEAPLLEVIRHEANQGLGGARNTGIKAARGEFVAFLDHDDLWCPGHVSELMAWMTAENADFGFCSVMQFRDDPADVLGVWGPNDQIMDETLPFRLFRSNFITPSAVIARRSTLLALGGFGTDPDLHMCEDLDLWLRALEAGARFAHSTLPTAYYRKHDSAATSRQGYMAYQSAHVRSIHQSRVKGPWFEKRSIVAALWWQALLSLKKAGTFRWDVLGRAVVSGIPVPWELAKGVLHLFGIRLRPQAQRLDAAT